jgi:hypothetical protein
MDEVKVCLYSSHAHHVSDLLIVASLNIVHISSKTKFLGVHYSAAAAAAAATTAAVS